MRRDAGRVEHVEKIYPSGASHFIAWLAHRVQRRAGEAASVPEPARPIEPSRLL
jgi:hypothetical protein